MYQNNFCDLKTRFPDWHIRFSPSTRMNTNRKVYGQYNSEGWPDRHSKHATRRCKRESNR